VALSALITNRPRQSVTRNQQGARWPAAIMRALHSHAMHGSLVDGLSAKCKASSKLHREPGYKVARGY
jgi:hypothetical protein